MPVNESLPKTGKSKDWLEYADKKNQAFRDYHGAVNVLGQLKNPPPLQDEYSKLLSKHELEARKMGMNLLRDEKKKEGAMESYRKGGRVKESGPATLHAGEKVVSRKTKRTAARGKSRSSSR